MLAAERPWRIAMTAGCLLLTVLGLAGTPLHAQHVKNAFFGDLHIHTKYSFDAFIFGTVTGPDDAYRFAQGETIKHAAGFDMTLDRPLDFYAVTDHAMFLGQLVALSNPDHELHEDAGAQPFLNLETVADRGHAFATFYQFLNDNRNMDDVRSAWQAIQDSANRHNRPGEFTTFIGYEYTTGHPSDGGNLHRNVIFASEKVPDVPFSRLESLNPEDLWAWLDKQREQGMEAIAIPHNANGSNGHMFEMTYTDGREIDQTYADLRMRNEPLLELAQVKGTSETHPALSPNDEWAGFEIFPYRIAQVQRSQPHGSYARDAWLRGLRLEREVGANPYTFGVVAASDTHNSGEVFDESNFVGKIGMLDVRPEDRGSIPGGTEDDRPLFRESASRWFGSAGIAGVWAEENTRASIFAAFRRKETFATSGTRIKLRFFAGTYPDDILEANDAIEQAYTNGVAMGSELVLEAEASPRFLVIASQDALRAKLQRIQIVKGWRDDSGATHESVFDIACSDGLEVDPETHRCPWNESTPSIADCSIPTNKGASVLTGNWQDPSFNPTERAFYYARVLENPVCRWSTWDARRNGTGVRPDLRQNRFIQERAWSSPIWIKPN